MQDERIEEQLRDLAAEWAVRLRLADWDIDVQLDDGLQLEEDEFARAIYYSPWSKALVLVSSPTRYRLISAGNPGAPEYDPEVLLVHELLHICFQGIKKKNPEKQRIFERGLTTVAKAMVDMKRIPRIRSSAFEAENRKPAEAGLAA